MESKKSAIAIGDFNAHNPIWKNFDNNKQNSLKICPTGKIIEDALNESTVTILNNGEATHAKGGAIDLAFATKNIAHKATFQVNDMLLSENDHFGISVFVQIAKFICAN